MRIKIAHKLLLGALMGLIVFGLVLVAALGLVTAVNGLAEEVIFDPIYFPLLLAMVGFLVPIVGIISADFDERATE